MNEKQLMNRVRSVKYTCFWLIGTMLLILADQVTKKLAVVYLKQQGDCFPDFRCSGTSVSGESGNGFWAFKRAAISFYSLLYYILRSSYLLFYKDPQDSLLQTADHYQWISCIRRNRQFYRQSCSWLCS